jgi:hypothetical protein
MRREYDLAAYLDRCADAFAQAARAQEPARYPDYAERLITTFPIKALVIPRVTGQAEAALRPLPPGDAFRVFGPSTVIWLPGAEAESYRFTAELTRRLPSYQLDLALEPARNTDAILNLLEKLG